MTALNWTNNQDINLYAEHWPVEKPIAVIALAHGQGEHIGRYNHVAEWYNAHDVAVVGFDHVVSGILERGRKRDQHQPIVVANQDGGVMRAHEFMDSNGRTTLETRSYPDAPAR